MVPFHWVNSALVLQINTGPPCNITVASVWSLQEKVGYFTTLHSCAAWQQALCHPILFRLPGLPADDSGQSLHLVDNGSAI